MRAASSLSLALAFVLVSPAALAEIYKYKKPNGQVIYTDNLADLPPERRDFYAKRKAERDLERREEEQRVGKEELERREAEAKRAELERASIADQERADRLRLIDLQLEAIKKKRLEREASREAWTQRMKAARDLLAKRLADFRAVQERHDAIAIKPSLTFLPGEAEELEKLRLEKERLEKEVDQSIEEVEVTIPEEARKAGIPPGYVR